MSAWCLPWVILSTSLLVTVHSQDDILNVLMCENSGQLPLSCPENKIIIPRTAFYGRDDESTCPHSTAVGAEPCSTSTALDVVRQMCEGMSLCQVDARVEYFGDPCPGIYKYLKLEYQCVECTNKHPDDHQCEFWRLHGECVSNSQWMTNNCRKTCTGCDVTPAECKNVHPADDECYLWAAQGECSTNLAWMLTYCRKACLRCDGLTECDKNRHDQQSGTSDCMQWEEEGECSRNPQFMLENCTKSCFKCDTDTVVRCRNSYGDDTRCDQWARDGECGANPGFMIPMCYRSCTECSVDPECVNLDDDDQCAGRVADSECSSNAVYMYKRCWKSCTNCQTPPACTDKYDDKVQCREWAHHGQCEKNSDFMMSNCALSCTKCQQATAQSKECVNYEDEEKCNDWAWKDECPKNPNWMLPYCRKSCTFCNQPKINLKKTGNEPIPGTTNIFTRSKSFVMPDAFPVTARLTHFMAYFANADPITFQVWRRLRGLRFAEVYSQTFEPAQIGSLETVLVPGCVMVNAGDRVGFTFKLNSPSPITTVMKRSNLFKETLFRGATSTAAFIQIRYPFIFSLAAGYDDTNLCDV